MMTSQRRTSVMNRVGPGSRHRAIWLLILVFIPGLASAQIQLGGLKWQDLYEKRSPGDTNRVKTLITSARAETAGANLHRGKGMRIESYTEDGKTNIVAKATDCL